MRLANCLHASGNVWSALALYRGEVQAVCDIVNFLTRAVGVGENVLSDNCAN